MLALCLISHFPLILKHIGFIFLITKIVSPNLNNGKLWDIPLWTLFNLLSVFQYTRDISQFKISLDHPVFNEDWYDFTNFNVYYLLYDGWLSGSSKKNAMHCTSLLITTMHYTFVCVQVFKILPVCIPCSPCFLNALLSEGVYVKPRSR